MGSPGSAEDTPRAPDLSTTSPLLELDHVTLSLPIADELRTILQDVSLTIDRGESVGLVGESGSGKSISARTIMRLLPRGAKVGGQVRFSGRSVLEFDRGELRSYHASQVAMIYQDPRAHINPLRTIGDFLTEGLRFTTNTSSTMARERAVAQLRAVGISDAEHRLEQHPHQLSGGLLQRVMIAAALLSEPSLIIADEPTTALDVTTQEEVMAILDDLRRERGLAMLFITHDLDLATAVTDRIAVMYGGVIVESGTSADIQTASIHPYTTGLLGSRPSATQVERLTTIPGRPVPAYETGPGCVFESRCVHSTDECATTRPQLRSVRGRLVACHLAEDLAEARELPQGVDR